MLKFISGQLEKGLNKCGCLEQERIWLHVWGVWAYIWMKLVHDAMHRVSKKQAQQISTNCSHQLSGMVGGGAVQPQDLGTSQPQRGPGTPSILNCCKDKCEKIWLTATRQAKLGHQSKEAALQVVQWRETPSLTGMNDYFKWLATELWGVLSFHIHTVYFLVWFHLCVNMGSVKSVVCFFSLEIRLDQSYNPLKNLNRWVNFSFITSSGRDQ